MKPQDRELIDRLAAEYVLGTLRGPARRRFERWRASTPLVDERCLFWEERLTPLAKGVRPMQPPPHVWEGIRARLNLSPAPLQLTALERASEVTGADDVTGARRRTPANGSRRAWTRTFALAASVVLVAVLGALIYWQTRSPGRLQELATIRTPSGASVWDVRIYGKAAQAGNLVVQTRSLPSRPPGRDYELWALPKGGAPVSLGVLPAQGEARHPLTEAQRKALAASTQLAVSIEPLGGSPTGQPTGKVVFVAPLAAVS